MGRFVVYKKRRFVVKKRLPSRYDLPFVVMYVKNGHHMAMRHFLYYTDALKFLDKALSMARYNEFYYIK